MSDKAFKTLWDHYQILKSIPIFLPGKFERCYSGKTANVRMYDAMFTAGLKLPLTELHHQLANYLGLSISQIAPNAWRIFIGAEVIWGQLNGGNHRLTLDEFFYCYKPQHISSSQRIYHFLARKMLFKLVLICLIPTGIGKINTFSSKGWTGCVDRRNGIVCLTSLTICGVL